MCVKYPKNARQAEETLPTELNFIHKNYKSLWWVWKLVPTAKGWKQVHYNICSLDAVWCQRGLHSSIAELPPLSLYALSHTCTDMSRREGKPLHMLGKQRASWITRLAGIPGFKINSGASLFEIIICPGLAEQFFSGGEGEGGGLGTGPKQWFD